MFNSEFNLAYYVPISTFNSMAASMETDLRKELCCDDDHDLVIGTFDVAVIVMHCCFFESYCQ